MTVKVLMRRQVPSDKNEELVILLKQLRMLVIHQPGYITGETMNRVDEPGETMVISTWQTVDDYMKWVFSKERAEIQEQIDKLLGEETEYKVYRYA